MQPAYFINHGGGPCFFLDPGPMRDMWRELETYVQGFAATLDERPEAILVVSGHWEEQRPTVNAGGAPPLLYDYGGFPAHTYQPAWPAPGQPALAAGSARCSKRQASPAVRTQCAVGTTAFSCR